MSARIRINWAVIVNDFIEVYTGKAKYPEPAEHVFNSAQFGAKVREVPGLVDHITNHGLAGLEMEIREKAPGVEHTTVLEIYPPEKAGTTWRVHLDPIPHNDESPQGYATDSEAATEDEAIKDAIQQMRESDWELGSGDKVMLIDLIPGPVQGSVRGNETWVLTSDGAELES